MAKSSSTKTSKKEATKKSIISSNNGSNPFPDRQKMIEEAAYFIAENRNFVKGNQNEDWFSAEQEIEAIFNNGKGDAKKIKQKKKT